MALLRRVPIWALALIIVAISGSLVYAGVSTGVIGRLLNPPNSTNTNQTQQPRESLTFLSFKINSGTSVTLNLQNSGNVSITFTGYTVKDNTNDQYSLTGWNGPTISPSTSVAVNIPIGSGCSGCVLTGNSFNYTYYDGMYLVTARGNGFYTPV